MATEISSDLRYLRDLHLVLVAMRVPERSCEVCHYACSICPASALLGMLLHSLMSQKLLVIEAGVFQPCTQVREAAPLLRSAEQLSSLLPCKMHGGVMNHSTSS
jgi:hypothetical protein